MSLRLIRHIVHDYWVPTELVDYKLDLGVFLVGYLDYAHFEVMEGFLFPPSNLPMNSTVKTENGCMKSWATKMYRRGNLTLTESY